VFIKSGNVILLRRPYQKCGFGS